MKPGQAQHVVGYTAQGVARLPIKGRSGEPGESVGIHGRAVFEQFDPINVYAIRTRGPGEAYVNFPALADVGGYVPVRSDGRGRDRGTPRANLDVSLAI